MGDKSKQPKPTKVRASFPPSDPALAEALTIYRTKLEAQIEVNRLENELSQKVCGLTPEQTKRYYKIIFEIKEKQIKTGLEEIDQIEFDQRIGILPG